jgi:hypothetical protein
MDVAEVVAAKRFVLVGDQGGRRAELTTEEGLVGLQVFDKGGSPAMILVGTDDEDGTPTVMIRRPAPDGQSYASVTLHVTDDGEAAIHLRDANGQTDILSTRRRGQQ